MNEKLTGAAGLLRRARPAARPLALALLLLGLGLTQTSGPGWRSSAQDASVTFAVIGDFGSNDANEAAVANLVKSWNPNFIVTVGDNNYPDGEAATIDANIGKYYHEYIYPYTGAYGAGATTNRFWPSVGNRDWENQTGARLQPYLNYFVLPGNERYYEFVQGPVHFFMLDSDSREPDGITSTSTQAQWLQVRLSTSNAPWKVVVLHHPPFSSRTSWSNLQWPFKAWGADVVLSGHAHIYERILRDGFPYLICGLGGESLGSFSTAISGSMVRYGSDYGALKVTASSTNLTFRFITRTGTVIDTYSLNKTTTAPAAPSNLVASAFSTSQINLNWTDNSASEDGFKIERSTDNLNFAEIATVGPDINAYSNTNLPQATTFYYRVSAFKGDADSGYSNVAQATTTQDPPAAPSGLTATAASSGQINLRWVDNSTTEESFEVERCQGAGCTNFGWVAETGPDATGYSNTGLLASTTYRYRVRASNGSGDSGYTNVAEATTPVASTGLPAPPSNLAGAAVSTAQINLSWGDNSNNETGFKLYRSADGGATFSRIATLGANVTAYSDTGRIANTTYFYYVVSYNAKGNSGPSNTINVKTFPPPTSPPAAPTGLVATAPSSTQVQLTWADKSADEKGFKVYRSLDGKSFAEIARPGPNSTGYADAGRTANTTYWYRVRAYNDAGSSAYSNTVSVRTP